METTLGGSGGLGWLQHTVVAGEAQGESARELGKVFAFLIEEKLFLSPHLLLPALNLDVMPGGVVAVSDYETNEDLRGS